VERGEHFRLVIGLKTGRVKNGAKFLKSVARQSARHFGYGALRF